MGDNSHNDLWCWVRRLDRESRALDERLEALEGRLDDAEDALADLGTRVAALECNQGGPLCRMEVSPEGYLIFVPLRPDGSVDTEQFNAFRVRDITPEVGEPAP